MIVNVNSLCVMTVDMDSLAMLIILMCLLILLSTMYVYVNLFCNNVVHVLGA